MMKTFVYVLKESDSFNFRVFAASRKNADRFLPRLVKKPEDWQFDRELEGSEL